MGERKQPTPPPQIGTKPDPSPASPARDLAKVDKAMHEAGWLLFCALEEEHRQRTGHDKRDHNACYVCQFLRKYERVVRDRVARGR